ncbi:DUF924 family protein [Synechococcales cyanobacterium C]|uniref:DUF924 family protein n=1 Tax=Petrachloros mirabilis ULC683 TaxID=2781853 RepID=A0A8K1ZZD6_9CYAN|nr:DUF924 family protein [Petrachloros mirabilis]NCJ06746.1 DUF924 family protein [Petrachloros mirabilis ULC683]
MFSDKRIETVLEFWFETLSPKQWWSKDAELDHLIQDRFGELHRQAAQCELYPWRDSAPGRLAEIIVLDQFSRNIFRNQPQAFAQDCQALVLAQEAVFCGDAAKLSPQQKAILYLPYMHSESRAIHEIAVRLYGELGLAENLDFELRHRAIVDRFGRYPHRNQILGRSSTPEEMEFLRQPGTSF